MIPVAAVGQLMLDHMPQPRRVLRRLRRHIDRRVKEAEEAGGVRSVGEIDGQDPVSRQQPAAAAQLPPEMEVAPQQAEGHREPDQPRQGAEEVRA